MPHMDTKFKVGQVWREVDDRFVRRVMVLAVDEKNQLVLLRNVKFAGGKGRWARMDRFNGKRGGYALD